MGEVGEIPIIVEALPTTEPPK